jgi:hypothetical protein
MDPALVPVLVVLAAAAAVVVQIGSAPLKARRGRPEQQR